MKHRVLVLLSLILSSVVAFADERPNIIFFLSDDHRWDQLGSAGHPILKTPNLDALAASGTRFRNAFVTTSICAASRATILTGLYERTHGYTFRTRPLKESDCQASYPQLLRNAGYRTGFVGKFGVGVPRGTPEAWFDVFKPLNRNPYFKKQPDGGKRHVTELAGDIAVDFIQSQPDDQPFSLSVSFNAAHAEDSDKKDHFPWPLAMNGMYDDVTIPEPAMSAPEIFDAHPGFLKKSLNRQRFFWRWDTPEKYQRNMKAYYRMLSGLDNVIGRVLEAVERQGLTDNTIVMFCGDNGYYMGQRGFAGKWSHYEESLRVPLIIRDPRVQSQWKGQVNDNVVLNVDLAATMLDYAGVEIPQTYQGTSLAGLVRGANARGWRQDFFCEHLMHYPPKPNSDDGGIPKWEGVRGQRWTYARYFEQDPAYEFLHDLQNDPQQLTNLASDPEYADRLNAMRERCNELRDAYGGEYSLEKYPLNQPAPRRRQRDRRQAAAQSYYLIGNSLTWDTVPSRLDGDVQWHVDCGKSLPWMFANPEKPCVKTSTLWPTALKDKQYDVISVQTHYGAGLKQDADVISRWAGMQPRATFVLHTGWAKHATRASEYAQKTVSGRMQHSPAYINALLKELRKRHPDREFRQTHAIDLLAIVAEDAAAGEAPWASVDQLYRDAIHMRTDTGRYLMHNAMRRALGQSPSTKGFEKVSAEHRRYLDSVLRRQAERSKAASIAK